MIVLFLLLVGVRWVWKTSYFDIKVIQSEITIEASEEVYNISTCIISAKTVQGTSGSAVFDASGRLISMVRGYITYYNGQIEYVTVPLSKILSFYEKTFGEKVQYQ